jgi:type I restriction enzyme R subunit
MRCLTLHSLVLQGHQSIPIEVAQIQAKGLSLEKIDQLKKDLVTMEAVIGDEDRLNLVVDDILKHYKIRKDILKGKAMIVAYSRKIAFRMYQLIVAKAPELADPTFDWS